MGKGVCGWEKESQSLVLAAGRHRSHSLHGIAVSALSPCSRAPKTNSGDSAFACVAAVLSLQLVALLLNKNPNSRLLFSMS